ncbi:MAG: hypothetical protein SWH78_09525 [Thermodesulfobacteriota bacterium]|nr:hypothetical protein [Thermodesulfobacteriota bacterium]
MPHQIVPVNQFGFCHLGFEMAEIRGYDLMRKMYQFADRFVTRPCLGTLIGEAVYQEPDDVVLVFCDKAHHAFRGKALSLKGVEQEQGKEVFLNHEGDV